jgi:glutathione S-transferase fosA5
VAIAGINHITLTTSDVERALRFYVDILGSRVLARWPKGAYLLAGDLWLALVHGRDETRIDSDYSHIAFHASAEALSEIASRASAADVETWQQNWTEGDSLYLTDPSGRRIEVHSTTLLDRLRHSAQHPWDGLVMEPDALDVAAGRSGDRPHP